MTTAPDPKTVREIATEHILDDARRAHDIGADVLGHFGPDALTKAEYHAYCDAIREAITTATVAVSWPDEQPQDELAELHDEYANLSVEANQIADRAGKYREEIMRLRARVRELEAAQDERDGDVRVVKALLDALAVGGRGWGEADALVARFADRIAALEVRDAKAGE